MSFYAYWTLFALATVVLGSAASSVRQAVAGPLLIAGFSGGLALFFAQWQVSTPLLAGLVAVLAGAAAGIQRPDRRSETPMPGVTASPAHTQPPAAAAVARRAPRRWACAIRGLAVAGAGFLAAQAGALLAVQGAPALAACAGMAALSIIAVGLAALRPGFAPRRLHDEALLFLLAAGLCLAAAPEVISGWRSATALNASARGPAEVAIPAWVWVAVGMATLAGAVSRWWRRN